ncbi:MAG TPA: hypothetical protein VF848_06355, partial [Steroidobacteraceae bacterium]
MTFKMPATGPDCAVWPELARAARAIDHIRQLIDADAERFAHCSAEAAGIMLDFSRQRINAAALRGLARLADELGLRERIAAMFRGDPINVTEGRSVLHTALRRPAGSPALI